MIAKKWWKSKTIQVNVVMLLLDLVSYANGQSSMMQEVKAALPVAAVVLNFLLRLLTNRPIEGSPADSSTTS